MKIIKKPKSIKLALLLSAVALSVFTVKANAALCSAYNIPSNSWSVMGDPKSNIVLITYEGLFFGPEPFTTPSATFTYQGITYTRGALITTCRTGPSVFDYDVSYYNVSGPVVAPPVPVGPTYINSSYEDQNIGCPSARPSGYIVQRRTFENWTDGRRNQSAWSSIADYCVAISYGTIRQDRVTACPAGQNGQIVQTHTYENWSDGTVRNITPYKVISNSCSAPPIILNQAKRTELCPIANTGKIQYKWEIYYIDEPKTVIDADGQSISFIVTTPYQREVLDYNSCKPIPTQTVQVKDRTDNQSCDSYYNTAGVYLGSVTKVYRDTTTYSSATQSSNTTSALVSQDITSCKLNPNLTYSFEQDVKPCPSGQTGTMSGTRIVATDTNGKKTYPQGMDFNYTNNNCAAPSVAEPPKGVEPKIELNVIANSTIVSSKLTSTTEANNIVDTVNRFKTSTEPTKLNLIINDLTSGKYNKDNVSNVIKAYSAKAGNNATYNITLPASIEKYVGNGNIKDSKNKMLIKAKLNSSKIVELTYADSTGKSKLQAPEIISTSFPIFDSQAAAILK
jgi:hypothetical protein